MRKTLTPDELFAFYMKQGHWLFMEPDRMIHILTGIKEMIKGRRDYLSAIELITTIPEAEKREMQKIYLMQHNIEIKGECNTIHELDVSWRWVRP